MRFAEENERNIHYEKRFRTSHSRSATRWTRFPTRVRHVHRRGRKGDRGVHAVRHVGAEVLSRFRTPVDILGVTRRKDLGRLALSWAVTP